MTQAGDISGRQWTNRQREAIETIDCSLLVSAAAGSGKTAVLAERCAQLVADEKHRCGIDQLLVVTFTESAAAEMKTRIQAALRARAERVPSDYLTLQVAMAEHAHVSTVHGFCARLLRQHFNLAGIDPAFEILDADEALLMRQEIVTDLFQRSYEAKENVDFHRLIDAYGNGNDEQLKDQVLRTHNLLTSLLDPTKWIFESGRAMTEAADNPLGESDLGKTLLHLIASSFDALSERCADARRTISSLGSAFAGYVSQLNEISRIVDHWKTVLREEGLDMLVSEVRDYRQAKPAAPRVKDGTPGKELAKALLDSVKQAVEKHPLADLLACTESEWREGLQKVVPHAVQFLDLVERFGQEYTEAKRAVRSLDFSDLERMTLNILREGEEDSLQPSQLARSLHRQFKHVLVDEYQDINPIQDAILTLVSGEGIGATPANLFCVGDVKQSIFRFRLAEPRRFMDRHRRFSESAAKNSPKGKSSSDGTSPGRVVDLQENFRSRAGLLEAINGVFARVMTRNAVEIEYDESHQLRAGREFPAATNGQSFAGAPIELHLLPKKRAGGEDGETDEDGDELEQAEYEAILLARRIREMMGMEARPRMNVCKPDASGNFISAPIEFGDIVILLRTLQKKADYFAEVLRAHGIPVHSDGGTGFFGATEIRDVLSLLQLLDNQQQDIPLAAFLRSPLAGLPDADDAMARIRLKYPGNKGPEVADIAFHQAVTRYAKEQDDELAARLRDLLKTLDRWRDQANKRPVAELIWHLYEETGYLAYCAGLEDGPQRAANLLELHERAGQFGTFLRQGLYRFLQFLCRLSEEKESNRPSPANDGESVVRIMSIHRSKGLEFPVVLMPDLGKGHNLQDAKGSILIDRAQGFGMEVVDQDRLIHYPSLASCLVGQSLLRQTLAEEVRLLYVGITRAKEHLILCGTCGEPQFEKWMSQWNGHIGPLPPDEILGARCVLDWVGPVAAMTAKSGKPVFAVTQHTAPDVITWKNPRHTLPKFSPIQEKLARLEELGAEPPVDPATEELIRRFERRYAYEAFVHREATASVTSRAKANVRDGVVDRLGDLLNQPLEKKLDLPRFFADQSPAKATDKGNATHLLLEHFDFSRGGSAAQIEQQVKELIERGLIAERDAGLIDRETIAWFLESDIGRTVRQNAAKLMRELPFVLADETGEHIQGQEPMDRAIIRGRIDLLVPTEKGLMIVDYKTDRVFGEEEIARRTEGYALQMRFYAKALERIAGKNVVGIYLVFLTGKRVVEVK